MDIHTHGARMIVTDDEQSIIERYRKLNEMGRAKLEGWLDALCDRDDTVARRDHLKLVTRTKGA